MDNKEIVKKYFNKYFKAQYFKESDHEFKSLLRILNKKDKQLPTDEDIRSSIRKRHLLGGFYEGAKWMRDLITKS